MGPMLNCLRWFRIVEFSVWFKEFMGLPKCFLLSFLLLFLRLINFFVVAACSHSFFRRFFYRLSWFSHPSPATVAAHMNMCCVRLVVFRWLSGLSSSCSIFVCRDFWIFKWKSTLMGMELSMWCQCNRMSHAYIASSAFSLSLSF